MRLPNVKPIYTIDQYLVMERAAETRHEYLDGSVYAMAGESGAHGDITVNLVGIFYNQLKGKPCRARTKDTKVRSGPDVMSGKSSSGLFSYPDVVIVCGEPEYHDAHTDVVLNPSVICEVLSPTTEAFDRGEKFARYQTWNPTLTDYLLVSQDRARIEHYSRQPDGGWTYRLHADRDATVAIPSIQCELRLSDVYDRVVFSDQ